MTRELQRSDDPPAVWVGRCLPYGEAGPYAPLRDVLLRAATVRPDDAPDEAIARVTGFLHALVVEFHRFHPPGYERQQ